MEKAGIPELERRLIINLYWHQKAAVRWDNKSSKYVDIKRDETGVHNITHTV